MIWSALSWIFLWVLSLRYRIEIKGLDHLKKVKKGGVLFLPNHAAHMDPLFLFLILWPKYRLVPLVVDYIYRQPILHGLLRWMEAQVVPDFDHSVNQIKVKRVERAMGGIVKALSAGRNIILYPSGHLKATGKEVIGGASGAHAIIQACPEANVVLIRTTGLWGSSFSRALIGRTPDLFPLAFKGAWIVIKNLFFFTPRRRITIEFETAPSDFPATGSRLEVNRYLESWYNQYPDREGKRQEVEPLSLVRTSLWNTSTPKAYQAPKKTKSNGSTPIPMEIRSKIYQEVRRILERPEEEIRPEMHLAIDLGMDSLNIAELIAFLSMHYDLDEVHPDDLQTVQDALELAEGSRASAGSAFPEKKSRWPEEKERPDPSFPTGRILPEAFFYACDRMKSAVACADDTAGVMRYDRMKKVILVLAQAFKKLPGQRVGVLLPASVGAYMVILALMVAKKTPVMINWTLGPRYVDDMVRLSGLKVALTSGRFLDRLTAVDFGSLLTIDTLLLLEEIREEISLVMKLKGALLSLFPTKPLLTALGLNAVKETDPAVILFTSGTETSPKGVPLSHSNILLNQRSAMQCIQLRKSDILFGILPPFHSFGFSVVGLLPLFMGIKVAYFPDPTDSFALAEGIERWKVTLFCSAPSFIKGLFDAAKPSQLKSVRLFISGAEKAPPILIEKIRSLGTKAQFIEGYGITECAPILSLHRIGLPLVGVGHPLPDIELCTIHPETHELLPHGTEGEICVRGPNVFAGYLGQVKSPFIQIDGKSWYRTGDLGYLDRDGHLILSGRLKRFIKVGGEMISLGAIESTLASELKVPDAEHAFALAAKESPGEKPQLILFTTVPLERDAANQALQASGFSRLIKITSVQKIGEIPLLGTGKTDYRRLQSLIV